MPRCWIGLGGNQGDVPAVFGEIQRRLLTDLHARFALMSPLFRTAPVGAQAGLPFWNAVTLFDADVEPLALLDRLQAWESEFGRVRTVRWGPRTLDLDLLFYDALVLETPRLTVPHPGAWYRRFVLEPLLCVAPVLMHPLWRLSIQQLHDRLAVRPPELVLWSARREDSAAWCQRLQPWLPKVTITVSDGDTTASHGLMIVLGEEAPVTWRTSPHLRLDLQLPAEKLEQSLIDACVAAFDVPVCMES